VYTLTIDNGDVVAALTALDKLKTDVDAIAASDHEVELGDTSDTVVTSDPSITLDAGTTITGSGLTVANGALDASLQATLTGNVVLKIDSNVFNVTASVYSSGVVSTPVDVVFTGILANGGYQYTVSVTVAVTTSA
jgi:hypothetical protein